MNNAEVRRHCDEIDRCNQRGGRMLSIVDLIEAGTFTKELAACALGAIGRGASFMVGARPGGAGKTAVMGALLNFVPSDVRLVPADGMATIKKGLEAATPRSCYICHEFGRGRYYAYLWGEELRAYFEVPKAGHMLATNLHADTYEQAREQICGENNVPESAFRGMNLMFFLSVKPRRRIEEVWESDGHEPHRRVYSAQAPRVDIDSRGLAFRNPDFAVRSRKVIDRLLAHGVRTIEDVRTAVLGTRGTG